MLSWGADWRAVSSANANGTVFSVDIDSIVERDSLISAWTMESRKSPKNMNLHGKRFKYMSYKALRYFNCDSGRSAIAQGIFYSRRSGAGDVLHSFSDEPTEKLFSAVVPSTMGEAMYELVCDRLYRPKVQT